MTSLTPLQAANLAHAVYGIRQHDRIGSVAEGIATRMRGVGNQIADLWNVDLPLDEVLVGTSGAGRFARASGFALVLEGRGPLAGHRAVAIRGTQTGPDWLSNINILTTSGAGGTPVHAGFNTLYGTLRGGILPRLEGNNGPLHLIGHSLGGALSTLLADEVARPGGTTPWLYTFGSPRVGTEAFAQSVNRRLGHRQFRVYDIADPVPVLPVFPFRHATADDDGLRIGSSGALLSLDKHDMRANYRDTVAGQTWTGLAAGAARIRNYRGVEALLDGAAKHVSIPGAAMGLRLLGRALQAIVDIVFVGAMVVETCLDKLAALIVRAAQTTARLGAAVLRFMRLALRWAGEGVHRGVELTERFLRWVLEWMIRPVANAARGAIDRFS